MDAWLKTHATKGLPTAGALFHAGGCWCGPRAPEPPAGRGGGSRGLVNRLDSRDETVDEAPFGQGGSYFCGASVASLGLNDPGAESQNVGGAERRQLTVLFCDMVGSTQIAAAFDAEDWREMLREYQQFVASSVEALDGSVAQYLGDGVVAYFGYPEAHEDDAERAVRAGLEVVTALLSRREELERRYGQPLSCRIGIHTGPVVIGEVGGGGRSEMLAIGATTNVAARLQSAAHPNTVVISKATLNLVRGMFVVEDLGAHTLKGFANPVELYRVVEPTEAATRFDIASHEGFTKFVGRQRELDLLHDRWNQSKSGTGQVVLIEGEAGIGKSRSARVFRDRLSDESHRWVEFRASKFHGSTAFHPLIKLTRQTFGLAADDPVEHQLSQLERGLAEMGFEPTEAVPTFAGLLGLSTTEDPDPFELTIDSRRKTTLDLLSRWLLAQAKTEPMVLFVEDLHWLDSSTLELLSLLIERGPSERVLLLSTFRPNFEVPWRLGDSVTHLRLESLSREEAKAMVLEVTGGIALPAVVLEQVIERTDGVPLFIEEFAKAVLESGAIAKRADRYQETGPIPRFSVPSTLQDSLMARLDLLGPAKMTAQTAAVLGRDFSKPVLEGVASDTSSLDDDLTRLIRAGILERMGGETTERYSFRHALIQDTAYNALLKAKRRAMHARIVEVLEADFASDVAAEPERLGWHCEQGGLLRKAIRFYERASVQAQQRSAAAESIQHLNRALGLIRRLPAGDARDALELPFQLELGKTIAAAQGWGNADAERAYQRARELCEEVGDIPQLFQVIRGLVIYYTAKSELKTANELVGRMTELAEESQTPELLLPAHAQLGILGYFDGRPRDAVDEFLRAVEHYAKINPAIMLQLYGEDLGVLARIWMSWSQWLIGLPDQAVQSCRDAEAIADEVDHEFTRAYAFLWTCMLRILRREPALAREMAERTIEISTRHGFGLLVAQARLMAAWTRVAESLDAEETQEATMRFQACANEVSATGILANAPVMVGFLSDAYHRAGQVPMALAVLEGGLALSMATGQSQWDAELHRLKGEFLLRSQGDESEVENLFRTARRIAEETGALTLELRAAMSLARLRQRQGATDQVAPLLEPVLERFTEGFDCVDLVEARELVGG